MAACDRLGVAYNSEFSPLSDLTFALLLTRAGVRWRYAPLEGGVCEIVWPPIYGVHLMQIDKHLTTAERRFAMRHGLAHVLDGAGWIDGVRMRLHQRVVPGDATWAFAVALWPEDDDGMAHAARTVAGSVRMR